MGFLGPIPASKLDASYDSVKRELTLYAEGEVMNFTYDINIVMPD